LQGYFFHPIASEFAYSVKNPRAELCDTDQYLHWEDSTHDRVFLIPSCVHRMAAVENLLERAEKLYFFPGAVSEAPNDVGKTIDLAHQMDVHTMISV
jgi:hypothetical protein